MYHSIADSDSKTGKKHLIFEKEYTTEEAIDHIGFGTFQLRVGLVASLTWIADSMEVNILGLLGPVLKCEWLLEDYQIALYSSIVFIAIAIFTPFIGILSDRYGRRAILCLILLIGAYFGILSAFSPLYIWLIFLRFILGCMFGGLPVSTVYASEFIPKKNRGILLSYVTMVSWAVGSMLEVLLAFAILNWLGWRVWIAASSVPLFFAGLLVIFSPKTPRYSLVSGNWQEAKKTLQLMAKWNKSSLPEGELVKSIPVSTDGPFQDRIKDLFSDGYRMITILTMSYGFLVQFTYYGTLMSSAHLISNTGSASILGGSSTDDSICKLNCAGLSQGDLGDVAITAFAEFMGAAIVGSFLDKVGRKFILSVPMVILGLLIALMTVVPSNRTFLIICLFGARFIAITPSTTIYIYCSEVYPTSFRATGVSTAFLCGRIGAAVSPFLSQVFINAHPVLALVTFSIVAFLAAITAALLPIETNGREMQE